MSDTDWTYVEHWIRSRETFAVEITRSDFGYKPGSLWNVYGYAYRGHALFVEMNKIDNLSDTNFHEPLKDAPLHCGNSRTRRHFNSARVAMSIQFGADYNHLHDDHYADYDDLDAVPDVKRDAKNLFNWLETMTNWSTT